MHDIRAADRDRDQVIEILSHAAGEGRLTFEEFEERCGRAQEARMLSDLAALTADLGVPEPVPVYSTPPPSAAPRTRPRPAATRSSLLPVWIVVATVVLLGLAGIAVVLPSSQREVSVSRGVFSDPPEMGVPAAPNQPEIAGSAPLASMQWVGEGWTAGEIEANGALLVRSLFTADLASRASVTVPLDGGPYSRLETTLAAVSGDGAPAAITYEMFLDGAHVGTHRVRSTDSVAVTVGVAGARTVRIEAVRVEGTAPPTAVIGNPTVHRDP